MKGYTLGLAASPWIVALVILGGLAFAIYSYRRTSPPVPPLRRWTLITLRTLGIGLLLLALFEPVLSLLNINAEQPEVVVAIDNSESMTLAGSDSSRIAEARAIATRLVGSKLAERIRFVTFSDSAKPLAAYRPDSLRAIGGETRMESPFTLAADSLRRKNIRAIVVMSDGRYNTGANPLFAAEGLGVPVYAVGMGDSIEPRDLSVQQIFTNEIAYLGTELPVEVRVKSAGYADGNATLTLRDDNGVVASQQIALAPGTNEYTANFLYKPHAEGIAKLRAEIGGGGQELTPKNNSRTAYVKVKSNKRRYVMISGAPNPDVAFLRRLLSVDQNIEVKSFVQKGGPDFIEGKLEAAAFKDAEAIVLVDFPTSASSPDAIRLIKSMAQESNIPLFVILGNTVDINRLKELESLLPVTFGPPRPAEMQIFADITEEGKNNPITRVRKMEGWDQLPPIYRSETTARAKPEAEVLARARLGNAHLDDPLIVARKLGRSRSMVVLGYGIYRWQLLGEGPRQERGDAVPGVLEDFISNSLRWLAVRDENKQVRIVTSKQIYNLGEPVRILAQVYDESFNPLNDAQVVVDVRGAEKNYTVTLAAAGSGRYEGTLGNLPAGDYSFGGKATANGKEIGRDEGRFAIGEVGLEFLQPSMNAELLRSLATRTGGRFYTPRQTGSLADDILANKGFAPRSLESRNDTPLWNYPWVLAAALMAFAIEWVIRKRSGML
ncbi:MAG: vWA domain-containing protein [Candidatus Kapaibacterium sp.]